MLVRLVGGEKSDPLEYKHITLAAKSGQIHAGWKRMISENDFSGWM